MENSNIAIIISVIGLIGALASLFITFLFNRKTDIKNYFSLTLSLTQNVKDHISQISIWRKYQGESEGKYYFGYDAIYHSAIEFTNKKLLKGFLENNKALPAPSQMIIDRDSDDLDALAYREISGSFRNRFYSIIDSILLSAKILTTKSIRVSKFIDELDSDNERNLNDISSTALTTLSTSINAYLWVLILIFYYYEEDDRLKRILSDRHLCGNIENQVDNVLTDGVTRAKLIKKAISLIK